MCASWRKDLPHHWCIVGERASGSYQDPPEDTSSITLLGAASLRHPSHRLPHLYPPPSTPKGTLPGFQGAFNQRHGWVLRKGGRLSPRRSVDPWMGTCLPHSFLPCLWGWSALLPALGAGERPENSKSAKRCHHARSYLALNEHLLCAPCLERLSTQLRAHRNFPPQFLKLPNCSLEIMTCPCSLAKIKPCHFCLCFFIHFSHFWRS